MKKSTKKITDTSYQDSTEYYRYIIENSEEAILLTNPDGKIDYANPEACKLFGRTLKDICKVGRNGIVDLSDPRLPIALEKRKRKGKFKGELNFVKKDGTVFPGEISSVIFKDEIGKERTSMIIRDMTLQKKLEDSFKKYELKISSVFRSAPVGIGMKVNRIIKEVNDQFCTIFGYSREELIGKNSKMLYPKESEFKKFGMKKYEEIETSGFTQMVTKMKRKDGRIIDVFISSSPLNINDINQGITFMVLDITEQKIIEQQLIESESRFKDLFNNSGTSVLIIDKEGKYLLVNDKAAVVFGKPREEIEGKSMFDLLPYDIAKKYYNLNRALIKKGGHREYEDTFVLNNKKRTFYIVDRVLKNLEGKNYALQSSSIDITEQKIAEEKTQLLAHTTKSIEEIITITDLKDRFTYVNQAFCDIYGYSYEEIIGQHVNILLSPNNPPDLLKDVLSHSHTDGWKGEILNLTKDGKEFPIYLQTSQILNENGEIMGLAGISEDISERKRAELKLKKSEEKYHAIFEATGTATLIVEEDTTISMANKECERITGYTKNELIGTKWIKYVDPSSLPDMLKYHNLRRKNPELAPKNYEVKLVNKNGEARDAILDIGMILNTKQSIVSILDITERKRAELTILNSRIFLDSIIEQSPYPVWISDDKGNLLRLNEACCKMLNISKDEVVGKYNLFKDNIVEEQGFMPLVKNVFEKGETAHFELHYDSSKLEHIPLEKTVNIILDVTIFPIKNAFGKTTNAVIQNDDITERKKTELALQESKRRLVEAQSRSHIGNWEYDTKLQKQYWSDEMYRLFNINPTLDVPVFSKFLELIHPDDRERINKNFFQAIGKGQHTKDIYRIIKPDGTIRWVEGNGAPVFDNDKKLIKFSGTTQDITERIIYEEELREEKQKQATLISNLPGFAYRCKNDKNWTMTFISDACQAITGYSPEDFINNKKIAFNDIILPKYQEYLWNKWQKVLNNKTKFEDEYEITSASGEIRWVWERGNGIYDEKGELLYLEGYIEDITKRKKIEESLKISEEKFRKVFTTSPDSININRLSDGMYSEINKGFTDTTGFTDEDIRGKTSFDISIWGNTDDRKRLLEGLKKDGTVKNLEFLFRKKNGELNSGLMSASIIDLNGTPHIISITRDITERKKAEEAIKKSELQFRTLFMSLSEGFYISEVIYDEKGNPYDYKYLEVNPEFEKIIGISREQIIGKSYKEIVSVDSTNWLDNYFAVAITGEPQTFEFYSEEYHVHFETYAYRPFKNQVCVFVRDISERKKAEDAIRDSERKFRETVENLQEGYYKCTIDGILLEHNPAFCEILGFESKKDLYGVKLPDFWQNPEDREAYLKNMEKEGFIKNYPVNAKNISGDSMYILVNSHLLKNKNGKYTGIEGTIVDLTEQKRADDALKESEIKYKNLIETMPEGFYRSTPKGYFVDVNPAIVKMLGYNSKEELMKVNIPEELYFSKDERIDGVNYNLDFISDTEIYRLKKKDGSEIWVEDHSRYIQDSSGKILYHEGIMRDITDSLRAQKTIFEAKEKAEEASRLKSSFLANMSHEIRTPLNGILGFSEILKSELKDPSLIRYADVIEKSGNRLLETLDMILNFSKLEAEKEEVHYSNVRIENVIDEVIKSFEAMANNKSLYLKSSFKEKNLVTKIDERFLRQILNNLVNNAIKYTNTGGVEVELIKEEMDVVIKVKDTGIGIAKDKQKIIFEEFRQESEGHGRSFEGTGLGLAITKRFVELMKGKIEVDSEFGVGTIFTVRFPFETAEQTISIKIKKDEQKKEINIPAPAEEDKSSVLIVENDSMNLDYTIAILRSYYKIESAVEGMEAIEKAKAKIFDIILMDINLGKGMSGIEVVRKIRELPEYKKTPIVALTAFVLPGDREEFINGGCTHYLGKPFTKSEILELLESIKSKK